MLYCLLTSSCGIFRQHFLQCSQGMLTKHFEKLIQCDMRLNFLSRQPEIILDSPHFDSWSSANEDPSNPKDLDQVSATSCFQQIGSPLASQSSFKIEYEDCPSLALDHQSHEAPSSSSGTNRIWLKISSGGKTKIPHPPIPTCPQTEKARHKKNSHTIT